MTQADVSNAVNSVINAYPNGTRIGYSGVEVGQCPAPVCEYMARLGIPTPSMFGDRADGWGVKFPAELAPYFEHEQFIPGKVYPEGTILIWNSPHIAFLVAASDGSNSVKVFEQNADPDGAACQTYNREVNNQFHTCTWALIPIVAAAAPPNPQPVCSYTPEPDSSRTMQTNKQPTNWWNLNVFTANIGDFQAAAQLDQGTHFAIGGYAVNQHFPNYSYAMSPADFQRALSGDYSTNNGINVLDLEEIPAPVPAVPYNPPAAPVPFPKAAQLKLVGTVPAYSKDTDAATGINKTGELPAGQYYIYALTNGMLNLSSINGTEGLWINPKDNVEPVVVPVEVVPPVAVEPPKVSPVDWRTTYRAFHPGTGVGKVTVPDIYTAQIDGTIEDLSDQANFKVDITAGHKYQVYGSFTWGNGKKYYLLRIPRDSVLVWWFAAPFTYNGRAVLTKDVTWLDKLFHRGEQLKSIFIDEEAKFIDFVPKGWLKKNK